MEVLLAKVSACPIRSTRVRTRAAPNPFAHAFLSSHLREFRLSSRGIQNTATDDRQNRPEEVHLGLRRCRQRTRTCRFVRSHSATNADQRQERLVLGYGKALTQDAQQCLQKAKMMASRQLLYVPICDGHTLFHDFYEPYYFTKIRCEKRPPGKYNPSCHVRSAHRFVRRLRTSLPSHRCSPLSIDRHQRHVRQNRGSNQSTEHHQSVHSRSTETGTHSPDAFSYQLPPPLVRKPTKIGRTPSSCISSSTVPRTITIHVYWPVRTADNHREHHWKSIPMRISILSVCATRDARSIRNSSANTASRGMRVKTRPETDGTSIFADAIGFVRSFISERSNRTSVVGNGARECRGRTIGSHGREAVRFVLPLSGRAPHGCAQAAQTTQANRLVSSCVIFIRCRLKISI